MRIRGHHKCDNDKDRWMASTGDNDEDMRTSSTDDNVTHRDWDS